MGLGAARRECKTVAMWMGECWLGKVSLMGKSGWKYESFGEESVEDKCRVSLKSGGGGDGVIASWVRVS